MVGPDLPDEPGWGRTVTSPGDGASLPVLLLVRFSIHKHVNMYFHQVSFKSFEFFSFFKFVFICDLSVLSLRFVYRPNCKMALHGSRRFIFYFNVLFIVFLISLVKPAKVLQGSKHFLLVAVNKASSGWITVVSDQTWQKKT